MSPDTVTSTPLLPIMEMETHVVGGTPPTTGHVITVVQVVQMLRQKILKSFETGGGAHQGQETLKHMRTHGDTVMPVWLILQVVKSLDSTN